MLTSWLELYIAVALGYSITRKTLHVWDGKIEIYDMRTRTIVKTPLLLTSKLFIVAVHAVYGIFLSPYYFLMDLQTFEIRLRGLNFMNFNIYKPTTFTDYLFM